MFDNLCPYKSIQYICREQLFEPPFNKCFAYRWHSRPVKTMHPSNLELEKQQRYAILNRVVLLDDRHSPECCHLIGWRTHSRILSYDWMTDTNLNVVIWLDKTMWKYQETSALLWSFILSLAGIPFYFGSIPARGHLVYWQQSVCTGFCSHLCWQDCLCRVSVSFLIYTQSKQL
jgi:hypothetical protein